MTLRETRAREAARLRATGMVLREIAERMGISASYAQELVADPSGEAKQERKRRYDGVCVDCGGRVSGTDPARAAPLHRCVPCRRRFEHESRYWTPERVIAAIQEHAIDGEAPTASDVGSLRTMAVREFGAWSAACEAAGLGSRRPGGSQPRRWTRERILDAIRDNARDCGGGPTGREMSAAGLSGAYQAAYRRFGSWTAAVRAAGLTPRDGRGGKRRAPRCFMEELQPHTCLGTATQDPDGSGEPYLCESCSKDVAA